MSRLEIDISSSVPFVLLHFGLFGKRSILENIQACKATRRNSSARAQLIPTTLNQRTINQ